MKLTLSSQIKTELKQVVQITLAWIILGNIAIVYDYSLSYAPYATFEGITLGQLLITQTATSIISSFITGFLIVKFFLIWIRTRPYGQALLMIWGAYTLLSLSTAYISMNLFQSSKLNLPAFSPELQRVVFAFLFGGEFLRYYFLWLVILLLTMLAFLINDKYGPGVFKAFLFGKYFKPRRTERIFMFLDLRGSTRIAEKLGEVQYFSFLKQVFSDVTPAIIYSRGEIYQYVGDEIVVSWRMDKGLKNASCLTCFQEIQQALTPREEYYQIHFGIIPEFKAGLHCGYVIAGEMGAVKREIAYSGDVLNTTSRIQGKCNEMGVNVLLSHALTQRLEETESSISLQQAGEVSLSGKEEKMILYTLSPEMNLSD